MFLTVCTVVMLTYYALKITCWPMTGHLGDMTIETSLDKVWWAQLLEDHPKTMVGHQVVQKMNKDIHWTAA